MIADRVWRLHFAVRIIGTGKESSIFTKAWKGTQQFHETATLAKTALRATTPTIVYPFSNRFDISLPTSDKIFSFKARGKQS